ncbi:uncharacterized protein Z519_12388 [Cladophialophora bantiana CBS 173.52]|uniref:NAD(P)-binding protein n=1 Tax=Cladophialophora bantiana (strain ATCC 10958 / CBS 173.52 / CDC B-1940 / NIH 8579) TaxID=1442370 RepID=A0A0D2EAG3_CLAB1|nr:uncharacterized protein Z519_12388 [Cladophialophora bantiana CBS 173.52]KIW87091.1 hypothetical protein Z519_12388 [Cladophialophora bantiana CBS 173.52]
MPFTTKVEHLEPYDRLSPAKLASEYASKNILITGGGYGIGASIARAFAEARVASIVVVGRTESKLKATAEELKSAHPGTVVEYRTVNITSEESVKALFSSLTKPVDVLVNNAGFLSKPENFVHADLKEWWQSFEVNVLGTTFVLQQFLRARAKQNAKDQAVVVNLNTVGAYNVLVPFLSAYAASKAAMWRMMEIITMDIQTTTVVPGGVRFISVHPGFVKTAMADKSGLDGLFATTSPQLAAEFIVWAASEEASFLANRLAWVNWDVDELVARKQEIVEKDMLMTGMS